jgi:hypothetical protein
MLSATAQFSFSVGLFRFTLAPIQPLFVPAINKGNMLRGGFGHAFRRLCCVPQCKDVKTCPLAIACPYKAVFEPSPPPGAEALSKNQDIPRPFVFRPPLTEQTRFDPGQPFEFGLVLIGRALDYLPYFVLAFRELAAEGLGLNRAKCALERVEQVKLCSDERRHTDGEEGGGTKLIYSAQDQTFHAPEISSAGEWIKQRLSQLCISGSGPQRITIRFLTPTFLRVGGETIRRPEFHHVFKRLRDRINALSTFYGNGPLDVDFSDLGKQAEKIQTVACNVRWAERYRISSKTLQTHELSGLIGEATYQGDLAEFMPWIVLGEFVHIGKHAAWGGGKVKLQIICDQYHCSGQKFSILI